MYGNFLMEIPIGFGSSPSFTPPPSPPPAAAPATMASSAVAESAAKSLQSKGGAAAADYGTTGGAQGVNPLSVTTGKTTLGGVS